VKGGGLPLPLALFAALLAAFGVINVIWSHGVRVGAYLWIFAVATTSTAAVAVAVRDRAVLRRRARAAGTDMQVVSSPSFGAMLFGLAIGLTIFGNAFGHALIYVGFGLIAIAAARLGVETRAMSRAAAELARRERAASSEPPPAAALDGAGATQAPREGVPAGSETGAVGGEAD